jgi:hypothetical protein
MALHDILAADPRVQESKRRERMISLSTIRPTLTDPDVFQR